MKITTEPMPDQHPITPPPELLKQWEDDWFDERENVDVLLLQAFQAGADQELDACCAWLSDEALCESNTHRRLRAARRPKPPSLKEEALDDLHIAFDRGCLSEGQADTIRRALEALPE